MTEAPDAHAFHAGDRLRKAREQAGYTQVSFAKKLGISRDTVRAYETWAGLTHPREQTLRDWSGVTGFSLHWLKTGERLPGDGPLAQLVELRTFNPKSGSHLHLVASNLAPEPSVSSAAPRLLEVPASPIRLIR